MPSSASCGAVTPCRRAGHRIDAGLVLRERDRVADERLVEERHAEAVDAGRDPAVRRRAHRERVEQESELRALLVGRDPSRSKTFRCTSGSWILNEPPASSTRSRRGRRRSPSPRRDRSSSSSIDSSVGRVNGWCSASQRSSSASHLNSGKSVTQWNRHAASSTRLELAPQMEPQEAEDAGRPRPARRLRREPSCRARPKRRELVGERNFAIGELTSPLVAEHDVARPFAPQPLATSSSFASSARENALGAERNGRLRAAKTPNSDPRVNSVASWISTP